MQNSKRIALLTVLCVGVAVTAAMGQPLFAMERVGTGALRLMDASTGTDISPIGSSGLGFSLGMAMDPTTGIMYLADYSNLYTVNLATGATTPVGAFAPRGAMRDLTCDSAGNLYGVTGTDTGNYLVQIDKATAATTDLADLDGPANGLAFNPYEPMFLYHFYNGDSFEKIEIGSWARTPLAVIGAANKPRGLVYNRFMGVCHFFDSDGNFQNLLFVGPDVLINDTGADDSTDTFGLAFDQATTLPVEMSTFSIE